MEHQPLPGSLALRYVNAFVKTRCSRMRSACASCIVSRCQLNPGRLFALLMLDAVAIGAAILSFSPRNRLARLLVVLVLMIVGLCLAAMTLPVAIALLAISDIWLCPTCLIPRLSSSAGIVIAHCASFSCASACLSSCFIRRRSVTSKGSWCIGPLGD
jgi:hypothetical protein